MILAAIIGIIPQLTPEPQPQFVTIQGKVTDENKMPVAGVLVSFDGQNDRTSDDGRYVIRDIPTGFKTIRVEHINREIYKIALPFEDGNKIRTLDIVL